MKRKPALNAESFGGNPICLDLGAVGESDRPAALPCLRTWLQGLFDGNSGAEAIHGVSVNGLRSAASSMTAREIQVLALALRGFDSTASAEILNLSVRTVENHRSSLVRRYGLINLADLFRVICAQDLARQTMRGSASAQALDDDTQGNAT